MEWFCRDCQNANAASSESCTVCGASRLASGEPIFVGRAVAAPLPSEPSEAALAFKLAVASWFCCGPFTAVPAIYLAYREKQGIDRGLRPAENRSRANTAFWMAVGNLGATALYAVFTFSAMASV